VAGVAVRVGVVLAVARLGVGAAAEADADITRPNRARRLPSGVVKVSLDCRRRTAQVVGDLGDRQALSLAGLKCERNGGAALDHTVVAPEFRRTPCSRCIARISRLPQSDIGPNRAPCVLRQALSLAEGFEPSISCLPPPHPCRSTIVGRAAWCPPAAASRPHRSGRRPRRGRARWSRCADRTGHRRAA
jgi:hypothetical protein